MINRGRGEYLSIPGSRSRSTSLTRSNSRELCKGCREVSKLFSTQQSHQSDLKCQIHSKYQQLEQSANEGCVGCRVFRQALFLRQITWDEVRKLRQSNGEVCASLNDRTLDITVKKPCGYQISASVGYTKDNCVPPVKLSSKTNAPGTRREIQYWLEDCEENHDCLSLGWSNENEIYPAKLAHVCTETGELEIVPGSEVKDKNYVALSYQWGDEKAEDEQERKHIKGVKRLGNTERFKLSCLPDTLKDAIQIVADLGVHYIWIDALCIPSDNWNHEASRMHLVYGNAYFTLCLCSSIKTSEGLEFSRNAWELPSEPCNLSGNWLHNFDMSLDEVRSKAPLSSQAWLLQEEQLSPRIVYVCSQRIYWSCSKCQRMEMGSRTEGSQLTGRPLEDPSQQKMWRPPQEFLRTRYMRDIAGLHRQWLELVRDHTRRKIFKAEDRFPAMSGLAAQYLLPFRRRDRICDQEYLAGLWRRTFDHDLAWSVKVAENESSRLQSVAPTWSWASLPLQTEVDVPSDFVGCGEEFQVLVAQRDLKDDVLEAAMKGSEIRVVKVMGRLRPLLCKASEAKPWQEIIPRSGNEDIFNFKKHRSSYIHSVKRWEGKFIAKEPNTTPIVGQMDYLFREGQNDKWLKSLHCLQIGASTMLLLERGRKSDELGPDGQRLWCYSRVGLARNVHQTFFEDEVKQVLVLGEHDNTKRRTGSYDSIRSSTSSQRNQSTLSLNNTPEHPRRNGSWPRN